MRSPRVNERTRRRAGGGDFRPGRHRDSGGGQLLRRAPRAAVGAEHPVRGPGRRGRRGRAQRRAGHLQRDDAPVACDRRQHLVDHGDPGERHQLWSARRPADRRPLPVPVGRAPARSAAPRWPPARWARWSACCRPTFTVNAGLTALGDVLVGGNSTVSGNDATPSAWTSAGVSCPTRRRRGRRALQRHPGSEGQRRHHR